MLAAFLFAAETSSASALEDLLKYGPLGIFAFLLVTGLLVSKTQFDRVVKDRDEALAYARLLEEKFRNEFIPLVVQSNARNSEVIAALTDFRFFQTRESPRHAAQEGE